MGILLSTFSTKSITVHILNKKHHFTNLALDNPLEFGLNAHTKDRKQRSECSWRHPTPVVSIDIFCFLPFPTSNKYFPTCQVRVVRFYVCCPSFFFFLLLPSFFRLFLLVFADILAVLFARCQHGPPDCSGQRRTSTASSRLQWAAPDLNRRALERTGQRRTSPGELWSGLGNAGPQPGGSGADWATPDLTRGPPERSGQRRTSAARRYVRRCARNMSEKNVRKKCQKICQKKCQKICQKI